MKKNNIRVLALSYSNELFDEPSKAPGDTHIRLMTCSQEIELLIMIIHIYNTRSLKEKWLSENLLIIPTNSYNRAHSLIKMYKIAMDICKKEKITIVHSEDAIFTGFLAYLLKRKYSIPINICLFGGNLYDSSFLKTKPHHAIFSPLGRFVLKRADSIQVEASLIKESLIKNGINPEKIHQRPMIPYNLNEFFNAKGTELRNELINKKYDNIILFVGRMVKEKNLINFLKAIKLVLQKHPSTLLLMIGDGKERKKAFNFAQSIRINDNIKWLGHISHNELPKYYKAADIFALFSLSEGFPRVLMEAAAAGLPIVCSRVSGSTDTIINGESGFIVEINDINDFANKICLLLENHNLKEKFKKNAPMCIRKLGTFQEISINKQIQIWQNLVK